METYSDQLLGYTLPSRDARGRVIRLDSCLDKILGAHDYPAPIKHLLAEALILTALIGGLEKLPGGQMTMQAQTEGGVVRLLVCDYRVGEVGEGELRGYVDYDAVRLAELGANPSLFALFGKGYLAITFDRGKVSKEDTKFRQDTGQEDSHTSKNRYQGIVALEGASLAEACENYFIQSEQLPTLIRLAVETRGDSRESAANPIDKPTTIGGGLLIQHLPEGEAGRERLHVRGDHPQWEHVSVLAGSLRHEELIEEELSMEALIWRLFHEEDEVRVEQGSRIMRGCRCSQEHYATILARFPEAERVEMRDDHGKINVDCAFCSRIFVMEL